MLNFGRVLKVRVLIFNFILLKLWILLRSQVVIVACALRQDSQVKEKTRISILGQYIVHGSFIGYDAYHGNKTNQKYEQGTLQETNISPKNGILKMIFLFPRWDMLIPWRVRFSFPLQAQVIH